MDSAVKKTCLKNIFILFLILLFAPLYLHAAQENEKALQRIGKITTLYLNDQAETAKQEARELKRYLGVQLEQDEMLETLADFLSGEKADLQKIMDGSEKRPDAWALANVAIFAKNLNDMEKPDKAVLGVNLENFFNSIDNVKSETVLQWKKNVRSWQEWADLSFQPMQGLEPLPARKSLSSPGTDSAGETNLTTENDSAVAEKEDQPRADKGDQSGEKDEDSAAFQSLTAADRREIHEKKYKKRFMPQDFDFSSENSSLQKYLSSLTDERIQKLEKLRVKLLSGVKPNLLATFERNPYTGRIKLKRSSTNGTIALANENTLIIRRGRNSRRRNQVSWTDLAPEQIFTFLEYYGDMRMKLSDGTVSAKERKEHAANQYLVAAILADWYGEYDDALRLARKAYRANPEIQKKTEVLFLE